MPDRPKPSQTRCPSYLATHRWLVPLALLLRPIRWLPGVQVGLPVDSDAPQSCRSRRSACDDGRCYRSWARALRGASAFAPRSNALKLALDSCAFNSSGEGDGNECQRWEISRAPIPDDHPVSDVRDSGVRTFDPCGDVLPISYAPDSSGNVVPPSCKQ